MNGKTQSDKAPPKQPRITDKHHAVALALHRDGFGVGHGVIAGVTMPRMIRPYTGNARRTS